MTTGMVLGKFMPLHKGHLALIDFATQQCDRLILLLCHHPEEPIKAGIRLVWLNESIKNKKVQIISLCYDPEELSPHSRYSEEASSAWAVRLKNEFPEVDLFFSSEPYGAAVASCMQIEHRTFDLQRNHYPVSATEIRQAPMKYWEYLPEAVRPYFVKKICISGTESTGKSTLALRLAQHYQTVHVPEMARMVLGHTNDCTPEHLLQIAELQARAIGEKSKEANRILICDTGLHITRSYSRYLFQQKLIVPGWIEEANRFDLHIYLEKDCPFVQDGTRLDEVRRNELDKFHQQELASHSIQINRIGGNWAERFAQACLLIDDLLKP